jgi:SAM-dependent methyltransferase
MTHAFDQDYWDRVWQDDGASAMGSSPAHPHLVREIGDLTPGTALDAGCGAGAEAIWLAEQGWQVTGVDLADAALRRATERAEARGVGDRVRWVHADLTAWEPSSAYDLVTTHYTHPAMPQLDFYDRIAAWVAPGGTLLVIGHMDHGDHGHRDGDGQGGQPPSAASVTAADITARLDPAAWTVVTAEESHRTVTGPGGRPATLHDTVVRAQRCS